MRNQLAGDLDAIVLKALRKEPERRYRSVEELSEDVRRHLDRQPVRARRNSLVYRTGRLVRRNRAVVMTAVTMAALAALGLAFLSHRAIGTGAFPPGVDSMTSLAVLPLVSLSHDADQELFADGMTDALITDLSRIRSLRVVSWSSAMRYKGTEKSLPEIARALKVDRVVEGSVASSGKHIRITVRLVRASDDRQLWTESYQREGRDVLILQGDVARDVASQIHARITAQERQRLTSRPLTTPAAYQAYVRGRYFWNQMSEKSMKTAITYFEQALKEDPSYALAYSGLADAHFYLGYFLGHVPPREAMPRAKAAALKALALDDTIAEAHTSLAMVRFSYDWNWPEAEREFRRAIELNPSYATGHKTYAVFLGSMRRMDESVAQARLAVAADPVSLAVNDVLGEMLTYAGRYDEAIEQLLKTLELDPNFAMARESLGYAYDLKGMKAEAAEQLSRARALSGEKDGKATGAEWDGWHVTAMAMADRHAELGQRDDVMKWLEVAFEARSGALVMVNMGYPAIVKAMSSDPRFQDLTRRIGLP